MSMRPPKTDWYFSSTSAWRMSQSDVGRGMVADESAERVTCRKYEICPCALLRKGALLGGEQFLDTGLAQAEQFRELGFAESRFLTGALQLDEFALGIHHQVQVHRSCGVFGVTQIEQGLPIHDADADRGNSMEERIDKEFAFLRQLFNRKAKGHVSSGNGRRACAAVGLQHITVDPDGARTQFVEVEAGSHGAAD